MVSLLIADGSELGLMGLKSMFRDDDRVNVVGTCASSEELVNSAKMISPDIILIDYSSKNFTLDVIPKVKLENMNVKFVGITPFNSGQTILSAVKVGVESHVKKDCSLNEIRDAVFETLQGNKFFCGELVELMRGEKIDVENVDMDDLSCEPVMLSERELEIIKLIAEGYTNAQIAVVLHISNHTVNTHRKNIMKKLGVNNTAGIVMFAVKSQLVSPNKFRFTPNAE